MKPAAVPPGRHNVVLLVDDEGPFRENVAEHLGARGFEVLQASQGEAALALVRERAVDVAVVDLFMPGMDGLTLLERLKEIDPGMEVAILTGQGSIESAVEAMRKGAYHYVTKPARLRELEMVVRRALERVRLGRQNRALCEGERRRRPRPEIVAHAPAMRHLLAQAEGIAPADATVLIEGQTGTGKEVLAEFIHRKSARAGQPLSVLDCGALSETLVDAELFGHERGAFTGATEARPGILEVADGGTLLLDEVGDMAPPVQMRLLRWLERGAFRRIGSTQERFADVRVLAATHRDLDRLVSEGRFRQDLFQRLHVFRLRIPSLRERAEDILPLAEHFLARRPPSLEAVSLDDAARAALAAYAWPGNVRELSHTMERACLAARLSGSTKIGPEHLALPSASAPEGFLVSLEEAERRHIGSVLERLGGNRARAAQVLGITERHLYRLLQGAAGRPPTAGGEPAVTEA